MLYIDSIPTDLEPQLKEFEIYCYPVYLLEADGLELTLYEDVDINAYIRNLVLQDSDDY